MASGLLQVVAAPLWLRLRMSPRFRARVRFRERLSFRGVPVPHLRSLLGTIAVGLCLPGALPAQTSDSSRVTLDRLFESDEFAPEYLGEVRWLEGEAAYTKLEADSAAAPVPSLIRYDAETGRRDVWVPASR